MNQIGPVVDQTLKTGELLVREGLARQHDVDAALDVQSKEANKEDPLPRLDTYDGAGLPTEPGDHYLENHSDDESESMGIRTIGEILCGLYLITPLDLNRVLMKYDKRLKLGDMLKKMGTISEAQIQTALKYQESSAKPLLLGQILIEQHVITEKELYCALSRQHNLSYREFEGFTYDDSNKAELTGIIGRNFADENAVIPLTLEGNKLTVAIDSPERVLNIHELNSENPYLRIECILIRPERYNELFEELYGNAPSLPVKPESHSPIVSDVQQDKPEIDPEMDDEKPETPSDEDMEAFIHYLLKYGLTKNAESIHIEQIGENAAIRYRVGANLQGLNVPGLDEKLPHLIRDLILKLKEKAGLEGLDRDNPQSGVLHIRFRNSEATHQMEVGFRISVLPLDSGEMVTLTVCPASMPPLSIDEQGHSIHTQKQIKQLLKSSQGIILISGPERSLKEQTLYAAIKHRSGEGCKILMAADDGSPEIDGIIQVRVNQDHLTPEQLIKAFLDHDPDVIVVGTINDEETARAALAAANFGPLIIGGIDAPDSVSALWRLMALGVEREWIVQRVNGIVAQQRVRRLCPSCRKAYTPEPESWNALFDSYPARLTFYKGTGCSTCELVGYAGHTILSEVLIIDGEVSEAIRTGEAQTTIRQILAASGSKTLVDDGLLKLKQTTLDEMVRRIPLEMIGAYKTARKKETIGNDPYDGPYAQDMESHGPMKREWIIVSPRAEKSRVFEMYQDLKRLQNKGRKQDPEERTIFFDFIDETFHQVCREHRCRRVLFCMETHWSGSLFDLAFWAAPVFMKRHG